MKFKVCDTHFPAAWVGVEGLNLLRLDSRYYSPQYLEDDELLNSKNFDKKTIGQMAAMVKDGPGGWAFKANEYTTEGVPVIRASDLVNGLDLSKAVYMTEDKHQELKQSECLPGDLVISVRGTPGRAAIVPDSVKKANLNAAVVRVRLKKQWLTSGQFICAFLNSTFGRRVTERIANGAVQNNINLTEVRSIPVPVPDPLVQDYIGRKIEVAEKCRKEAAAYLNRAKKALEDALRVNVFSPVVPKISTSKPLKITSVKPSCSIVYPDFIKGVMGAHAYAAVHAQVELNFKHAGVKQVSLGSIVKEMVNGYDCRDFSETGTAYAKVAELRAGRLIPNPNQFVSIPLSDVPQKQRVKSGDLLITRKGSFGICANATEDDETVIISSEIIRLRLIDKYDSAYVSLFLNSNYGRSKFDRLATGTMMLGINHGNLTEIEIPILDTTIQKQIGDKCRVWQTILKKSEALVQSAKSDVEALIEGELDTDAILSGKLKAPTWEDIEKELEGI